MIDRERFSRATKPGDHFIGDQKDVMTAADIAHHRPVLGWRNKCCPGRAYHRLGDERHDLIRADFIYGPYQALWHRLVRNLDRFYQRDSDSNTPAVCEANPAGVG